MNEVRAIGQAFENATAAGEKCALATIVSVEGSSYRRPGAKMLVTEDGTATGSISAGCLEHDVIEHAKRVIHTGGIKLAVYDNASTSDEMAWGLGLGCNGVVRVLIEAIYEDSQYIAALQKSSEMRPDAPSIFAATVYEYVPATADSGNISVGCRLFISEEGRVSFDGMDHDGPAIADAIQMLIRSGAKLGEHSIDTETFEVKVFLEKLSPPVPLVIFGAGHDALPIVELARTLGWQTEVIDPQARDASSARFALADRITLVRPADIERRVAITPQTIALVMSHNYSDDIACLKFLLTSSARYIGVMGPRKRTERMLEELGTGDGAFQLEEHDLTRLHSPVGLDIGANSPVQVALSIVAEIQAVLEGRSGRMLCESRGPLNYVSHVNRSVDRTSASGRGFTVGA